ncbi:MAG: hydantoinase B/oxoprolinase family protein, partial [Pseudomonadota bacterium]
KSKQVRSPHSAVDPIMLEIFNNRFMYIAEQMGTILQKTAYSVNIRERRDFSCALFDVKGNLIANAPHIPVHLGSMEECVKAVIKRQPKMYQGDAYLINNPYLGGTHLPDVTLISPFFYKNSKPAFYLASRAHQADIGGITPGSMPAQSKSIEEEGVMITDFKLLDKNKLRETEYLNLLSTAKYPARNTHNNFADIQAQIAANYKGQQEMIKLIEEYNLGTVNAYVRHIQTNATFCVKQVVKKLKDGRYKLVMDNGIVINVSVRVARLNNTITLDFSGSSVHQSNNFNTPKAVCYAAILYVFGTLVEKNIPLNHGCLKPIKIIIPKASFLHPVKPAAVVAGNVEVSQNIVDALFAALNCLAASQGTMNNISFGNETLQYYETLCGGAGAGPGFNGASAVHTHMTNSLLTDPEVLEKRFPLYVKQYKIRKNSGGAGQWNGGDGIIREIEFLQSMVVSILSSRRQQPPFGMHGGKNAACGENWLIKASGSKQKLSGTVTVEVKNGDRIIIKTPGGGGWGAQE